MVFLFFEDIQRTPSPGFTPCQSPRGCPHSHAEAHRTPHSAHQPKPHQHSTNRSTDTEPGRLFKITLYSNPDEVTAHRVAPTETHRQPHREPERRRGVMGSPTDRSRPQRHTGGTEGNRKRPEPKLGALRLFIHFQQVEKNHQRKNQNAK